MVLFLSGASHTGKTLVSQKLLERLKIPYVSADHIKMGLIRSGVTALTPMDDDRLLPYLWDIEKEIAKTAAENNQSLIIEGCYVPHDWRESFSEEYLRDIRAVWLIMSKKYIRDNFAEIRDNANAIESRLDDSWLTPDALINDNAENLSGCILHGCDHVMINGKYSAEDIAEEVVNLIGG